jgi:deoxyribodipyrimidine photolyase
VNDLVRRTGLVWFKRDLRLDDHAPLQAAQACDRLDDITLQQ